VEEWKTAGNRIQNEVTGLSSARATTPSNSQAAAMRPHVSRAFAKAYIRFFFPSYFWLFWHSSSRFCYFCSRSRYFFIILAGYIHQATAPSASPSCNQHTTIWLPTANQSPFPLLAYHLIPTWGIMVALRQGKFFFFIRDL
jgi:hypothetical protein